MKYHKANVVRCLQHKILDTQNIKLLNILLQIIRYANQDDIRVVCYRDISTPLLTMNGTGWNSHMNLLSEAVAATCVTVLELQGMNVKMLYLQRQKFRIHKKLFAE